MRTVPVDAVVSGGERLEELPERVRDALGELAGAAREGLLAFSVGVGLGVLDELMAAGVDEVVGPRGRRDRDRVAVRHGREAGGVPLGGRRVAVQRRRVRSVDGGEEVALGTYRRFAARAALSAVVLERMRAGVSMRRYGRAQEPVGAGIERAARSTSGSAIGREFVSGTRETLVELMSRRLDAVRLAVLMIDAIVLRARTNGVALGVTTDGVKIALGRWDGSSDNATVATALLADLVDRGLGTEQGVLCVLDGSTALRKGRPRRARPRAGGRCVRHKERNVLEHLPERDRPPGQAPPAGRVGARRPRPRARPAQAARRRAAALPARAPPRRRAKACRRTLTLTRLGVRGALKKTLQSTNPCESMVRHEAP